MSRGRTLRSAAAGTALLAIAGAILMIPEPAVAVTRWANAVVGSIPLPGEVPLAVAIDPTGSTLYVGTDDAELLVVDTASGVVEQTVGIGDFGAIGGQGDPLAVTGDGAVVIAANLGDDTVSVIDAATASVTATLPVGGSPNAVAVSGSTAYVANTGDGTVSVIDTGTPAVVATIDPGIGVESATATPGGAELWIADGASSVGIVSTASTEPVGSVLGLDSPCAIAFAPDGSTAFILECVVGGSIAVVDTATLALTTRIPAGVGADGLPPQAMTMTADGSTLYVLGFSNQIAVVDTASRSVEQVLQPSPDVTNDAVVAPDGSVLYVADIHTAEILQYGFLPPEVTTTTLPDGVGGLPWGPVRVEGSSPSGLPLAFESSDLPAWLTLDPSGVLSGTPPTAGTVGFSVTAVDEHGNASAPRPLEILVHDPVDVEAIAPVPSARRVLEGSTVTLSLQAELFAGTTIPVSSGVVYSSDHPTDVIDGASVTFVDASTHTITATWGSFTADVAIVVIPTDDTGSVLWPNAVVDTVAGAYLAVAFAPDSSRAFAITDASLEVLDPATNAVTGSIGGLSPVALAVSPDGSRVVVADSAGSTHIIDTASLAISTVAHGGDPSDVASSPDSSRAFVANSSGAGWVIDLATRTIVGTVPGPADSLAVQPDGERLWIRSDETVQVVEIATADVIASFSTEWTDIGFSTDGTIALLCEDQWTLSLIDTATFERDTIEVRDDHLNCRFDATAAGGLYFATQPFHVSQGGEGVGHLYRLELGAPGVVTTLATSNFITSIAIAPDGGGGYAVDAGNLLVLAYAGPSGGAPTLPATGGDAAAARLGIAASLVIAGASLVGAAVMSRRRAVIR